MTAPTPDTAPGNEYADWDTVEPMGIYKPLASRAASDLLSSRLRFIQPLGTRSLSVVQPRLLESESLSVADDIRQNFQAFPFFEDSRSAAINPQPNAARPGPETPAPSRAWTSAPNQSAPAQPAPNQPAPTQSAPTQSAPTQPAPTQPAPAQPAPNQPAPNQSAPNQSAPTQPAPVHRAALPENPAASVMADTAEPLLSRSLIDPTVDVSADVADTDLSLADTEVTEPASEASPPSSDVSASGEQISVSPAPISSAPLSPTAIEPPSAVALTSDTSVSSPGTLNQSESSQETRLARKPDPSETDSDKAVPPVETKPRQSPEPGVSPEPVPVTAQGPSVRPSETRAIQRSPSASDADISTASTPEAPESTALEQIRSAVISSAAQMPAIQPAAASSEEIEAEDDTGTAGTHDFPSEAAGSLEDPTFPALQRSVDASEATSATVVPSPGIPSEIEPTNRREAPASQPSALSSLAQGAEPVVRTPAEALGAPVPTAGSAAAPMNASASGLIQAARSEEANQVQPASDDAISTRPDGGESGLVSRSPLPSESAADATFSGSLPQNSLPEALGVDTASIQPTSGDNLAASIPDSDAFQDLRDSEAAPAPPVQRQTVSADAPSGSTALTSERVETSVRPQAPVPNQTAAEAATPLSDADSDADSAPASSLLPQPLQRQPLAAESSAAAGLFAATPEPTRPESAGPVSDASLLPRQSASTGIPPEVPVSASESSTSSVGSQAAMPHPTDAEVSPPLRDSDSASASSHSLQPLQRQPLASESSAEAGLVPETPEAMPSEASVPTSDVSTPLSGSEAPSSQLLQRQPISTATPEASLPGSERSAPSIMPGESTLIAPVDHLEAPPIQRTATSLLSADSTPTELAGDNEDISTAESPIRPSPAAHRTPSASSTASFEGVAPPSPQPNPAAPSTAPALAPVPDSFGMRSPSNEPLQSEETAPPESTGDGISESSPPTIQRAIVPELDRPEVGASDRPVTPSDADSAPTVEVAENLTREQPGLTSPSAPLPATADHSSSPPASLSAGSFVQRQERSDDLLSTDSPASTQAESAIDSYPSIDSVIGSEITPAEIASSKESTVASAEPIATSPGNLVQRRVSPASEPDTGAEPADPAEPDVTVPGNLVQRRVSPASEPETRPEPADLAEPSLPDIAVSAETAAWAESPAAESPVDSQHAPDLPLERAEASESALPSQPHPAAAAHDFQDAVGESADPQSRSSPQSSSTASNLDPASHLAAAASAPSQPLDLQRSVRDDASLEPSTAGSSTSNPPTTRGAIEAVADTPLMQTRETTLGPAAPSLPLPDASSPPSPLQSAPGTEVADDTAMPLQRAAILPAAVPQDDSLEQPLADGPEVLTPPRPDALQAPLSQQPGQSQGNNQDQTLPLETAPLQPASQPPLQRASLETAVDPAQSPDSPLPSLAQTSSLQSAPMRAPLTPEQSADLPPSLAPSPSLQRAPLGDVSDQNRPIGLESQPVGQSLQAAPFDSIEPLPANSTDPPQPVALSPVGSLQPSGGIADDRVLDADNEVSGALVQPFRVNDVQLQRSLALPRVVQDLGVVMPLRSPLSLTAEAPLETVPRTVDLPSFPESASSTATEAATQPLIQRQLADSPPIKRARLSEAEIPAARSEADPAPGPSSTSPLDSASPDTLEDKATTPESAAATPDAWGSIADLLVQSAPVSAPQARSSEPPQTVTAADDSQATERPLVAAIAASDPFPDLRPVETVAPRIQRQGHPLPPELAPSTPAIQRRVEAPASSAGSAQPATEESDESAADSSGQLEKLAQVMYQAVRQRLAIERERLGQFGSSRFR